MLQSFEVTFRESIQIAFLFLLVLAFPRVRESRLLRLSFFGGALCAFLIGFSAGFLPGLSGTLWRHETWTFWRLAAETIIFYSGFYFAVGSRPADSRPLPAGLFALGFLLVLFEARSAGFLIRDIGAMSENITAVFAAGAAGLLCGAVIFVIAARHAGKIPLDEIFGLAGFLVFAGAFRFVTGGAGELEKGTIITHLQQGIGNFLGAAVENFREILLIAEHPFLDVPFSGLAGYISGERTSMALTVIFLVIPPVFLLVDLFGRPDPDVRGFVVGAQKRQKIAFFRKELVFRAIPAIAAFLMVVVLLHAVSISLNPLYEPAPIPVTASEAEGTLKIPVSGRTGSLSDKKMKKYIYYYGNKQIHFLAVLKPDGTVGLALDECEICRPAEWNVDAKGYAQRGEHLVCKYCMTPIATATVNNPGGCNPIPIPFKLEDDVIIISLDDLIRTYREVESLEKKGTHL